jgi:hypothetical protein
MLGAVLCLPTPQLHGEPRTSPLKFDHFLKFDEFGDLSADDQQARLDNYALQLNKMKEAVGFIIFHRAHDILPGWRIREVYGFQNYLVNSRGVDPTRLTIIEAEVRDKNITELWMAPAEASATVATTAGTAPEKLVAPTQFDSVTQGDGCVAEYTLVLEEPDDALRFFAQALRDHPEAKGFLLVHPSTRGSTRTAKTLLEDSRNTLLTKHQIAADRIVARLESPRRCLGIDLWLVPTNVVIPNSTTPNQFFQSQLMAEAERDRYSVRRVEFLGNEHIRDNIIRRRMLQNEGDVFRRDLLEQSLRSVSKIKQLQPVTINDVEVHLNRDEKTADFTIFFDERTKRHKF